MDAGQSGRLYTIVFVSFMHVASRGGSGGVGFSLCLDFSSLGDFAVVGSLDFAFSEFTVCKSFTDCATSFLS